jgi:N-acetyltransferase
LCQFSYTKGAPQDESLHRAHCARVQRGMEWGREEEREKIKWGVVEVASGVPLKDGSKGRIISFRADVGGRIKSKVISLSVYDGCTVHRAER